MLTIEEYLHTSGLDPEFVRGALVRRTGGTLDHSDAIVSCCGIFYELQRQGLQLFGAILVRVRIDDVTVRVPDLCFFSARPTENVPSVPPLVVIEVLSPDDRMVHTLDKLCDYARFGVAHIWLIETEKRALHIYSRGQLTMVNAFAIPDLAVSIPASAIFNR